MFVRLVLLFILLVSSTLVYGSYVLEGPQSSKDLEYIMDIKSKKGLRVFWWNVAWGKYNYHNYVNLNLAAIASSEYAPDVIALGEFKKTILDSYTAGTLKKYFPYTAYQPYHAKSGVGVKVYSKYPLTKYVGGQIDWSPIGGTSSEKSAFLSKYRKGTSHAAHWDRPFFFVRLKKYGREYDVAPLHLLSPFQGMVEVDGYWNTVKQAIWGRSNPLGYQINRMKAHLKANFGSQLIKRRFILIGDFNIPKSIMGKRPLMFEDLWRGTKRIYASGLPSFPTEAGKKDLGRLGSVIKSSIDHAFVSPLISRRKGRVLSMAGSDHYPLYIIAD